MSKDVRVLLKSKEGLTLEIWLHPRVVGNAGVLKFNQDLYCFRGMVSMEGELAVMFEEQDVLDLSFLTSLESKCKCGFGDTHPCVDCQNRLDKVEREKGFPIAPGTAYVIEYAQMLPDGPRISRHGQGCWPEWLRPLIGVAVPDEEEERRKANTTLGDVPEAYRAVRGSIEAIILTLEDRIAHNQNRHDRLAPDNFNRSARAGHESAVEAYTQALELVKEIPVDRLVEVRTKL